MLWLTIDETEKQNKTAGLYKAYGKLMYTIAFDILRDSALSEDAVHEAFVRVMKNLHKINEEDCPRTRNFLVIILRRVAIDIKKKNEPFYEYDEKLTKTTQSAEDNALIKDDVKRLAEIINNLEPIYREVFLLRRVHKLSRREIAKVLDINIETVKKRLVRAKKHIEEKSKEAGII